MMQTSIALSRPQNNRRGQTRVMILNSQWRRSLLIGGGVLTLPIFLGLALWQWIVKQNWTMLPL